MKKKNKEFAIQANLTSEDIKHIRNKLKLTQLEFGDLCSVSKRTVEKWETSETLIKGPIVSLIRMLELDPDFAKKMLIPNQTYPLRMIYMFKQSICTIIDVDERKREIMIKNFIDNPIYRAFGVNEEPDFEDYEKFLESRCFPRERDMMKLELRELDIPFYDPLMIVEKTNGRMAEDQFWLKIERIIIYD